MERGRLLEAYDRLMNNLKVSSKSDGIGGSILSKVLGVSTFAEAVEDIKRLINLVQDTISGDYKGLSIISSAIVLFTGLYFISPIDLIPDFIPFVGFVDDLLVMRVAIAFIQTEIDYYGDWQRNSEVEEAYYENVVEE